MNSNTPPSISLPWDGRYALVLRFLVSAEREGSLCCARGAQTSTEQLWTLFHQRCPAARELSTRYGLCEQAFASVVADHFTGRAVLRGSVFHGLQLLDSYQRAGDMHVLVSRWLVDCVAKRQLRFRQGERVRITVLYSLFWASLPASVPRHHHSLERFVEAMIVSADSYGLVYRQRQLLRRCYMYNVGLGLCAPTVVNVDVE